MRKSATPLDNHLDLWNRFRAVTRARIGLERCGDGLPTSALLEFQLAHAHARDTVHGAVDFEGLTRQIETAMRVVRVHSAARNRAMYLRRPDLGRRLDERSAALLEAERSPEPYDAAFVISDGLSSSAVNEHAVPMLKACLALIPEWKVAPVILAEQARVALGDEISMLVNSRLCVVMIGERPGLSVANSLGLYITWSPRIGHKDAHRNCISNIHADGLSYQKAATKLVWLMSEACRLGLTGVDLKENADGGHAAIHVAKTLSISVETDGKQRHG